MSNSISSLLDEFEFPSDDIRHIMSLVYRLKRCPSDSDVASELIDKFHPLIVGVAKRYFRPGIMDWNDFVHELRSYFIEATISKYEFEELPPSAREGKTVYPLFIRRYMAWRALALCQKASRYYDRIDSNYDIEDRDDIVCNEDNSLVLEALAMIEDGAGSMVADIFKRRVLEKQPVWEMARDLGMSDREAQRYLKRAKRVAKKAYGVTTKEIRDTHKKSCKQSDLNKLADDGWTVDEIVSGVSTESLRYGFPIYTTTIILQRGGLNA